MASCLIVHTLKGKVKGSVSKPNAPDSNDVYNFLSIPYGRPPTRELRFKPPQEAKKWDGVLDATKTLVNCPQDTSATLRHDKILPYGTRMKHDTDASSEDCLRLSIFTPSCDLGLKLPVMVWLTGGSYQRNTCGRTDGTSLAGMNQVVVVVLNFRVNLFGFLSLDGEACKGNMGLLDVQLALKWIKDEIGAFGGDTNNVTLFGESSGAGMVNLLMLSPLSEGLFHKAILQSGVAVSPFFYDKEPEVTRARFFERVFGSDMKDFGDTEILEKLQMMELKDLRKSFSSHLADGISFMPVVDGHVIPDEPIRLVKSGKFMRVPLLLGCTDSEAGCLLSLPVVPDYFEGPGEDQMKKVFEKLIFKQFKGLDTETAYSMIKKMYFKDDDSKFKYLRIETEFSSDGMFVVPAVQFATAYAASGQPTYLYHMRQQPDFNHSTTNGANITNKPHFVSCDHCDDLYFVWGTPFLPGHLNHDDVTFTDDERELSVNVMSYFANFAQYGDPNRGRSVPEEWPTYKPIDGERKHLVLKTPISAGQNLAMDKMELFTKMLGQ